MKVLSIGNSFSQDAQRYLHRLAKHNGMGMKTVNLYIPSCHLQTHYINMLDDNGAYDFEFNGESCICMSRYGFFLKNKARKMNIY